MVQKMYQRTELVMGQNVCMQQHCWQAVVTMKLFNMSTDTQLKKFNTNFNKNSTKIATQSSFSTEHQAYVFIIICYVDVVHRSLVVA